MSFYKRCLRPMLFACDPEWIHNRVIHAGALAGGSRLLRHRLQRRYTVGDPRLRTQLGPLELANPVGLAAGFDKSGYVVPLISAMGFGHVEIGSVSAMPSQGNPRPRLFRLPEDRAIVVNYGVPNEGAETVRRRLENQTRHVPLGVNLVATNTGQARPAETIIEDFLTSARLLAPVADYLAINMSCPNSDAECDFFAPTDHLARLLAGLQEDVNANCPVFLKIPALDNPDILGRLLEHTDRTPCVHGFSFNLRPGKHADLSPLSRSTEELSAMPGAVAGKPCEAYVNRSLATMYRLMDRQRYALTAGGGIFSAEDAYRKIRLGASAVQVYTSLVYEGPAVVRQINQGLAELLHRDGFSSSREAVGVDASEQSAIK